MFTNSECCHGAAFAPIIGKPYEGKLHVRIDEGVVETGHGGPSEAPFNRKGRETDMVNLRTRRHRSTLLGGFMFLDHFYHRAFAEENLMVEHVGGYMDRFGKLPPYVTADTKYGTLENRELMEKIGVRTSFKRRGRPPKTIDSRDRWFKRKQRERNRIEGGIGNSKEHYRCDRVRYSTKDGSEIWIRAGILAMNLKTAANRA